MNIHRETLLCDYQYDPLDRLVACTPSTQVNTQRFYVKDRLATEIQGTVQRSVMQHDDQLLAQQQHHTGSVKTRLLATNQQRSVIKVLDETKPDAFVYTPYGHRSPENGLVSLLGFNGEQPDMVTGHYLLGNGYRAFNPVLMRFNSPDSWSPFGKGGLNSYAYCVGDPVNLEDRTGHMPGFITTWLAKLELWYNGKFLTRSASQRALISPSNSVNTLSSASLKSASSRSIKTSVTNTTPTAVSMDKPSPMTPGNMLKPTPTHAYLTDPKAKAAIAENSATYTKKVHMGRARNSYAEKSSNLVNLVNSAKETLARPAAPGKPHIYSNESMQNFEKILSSVDELDDAWRLNSGTDWLAKKLRGTH